MKIIIGLFFVTMLLLKWHGFLLLRESKRKLQAIENEIEEVVLRSKGIDGFTNKQRYIIKLESLIFLILYDRELKHAIDTVSLFDPPSVLALKEKAIELNRKVDDDKLYLAEINKLNE